MAARYTTLKELVEASKQGKQVTLMLDNDSVYACTPDEDEAFDSFDMHPAELLEQALDLLGLKHEPV